MIKTLSSAIAKLAARLIVVVVFPTPPLRLETEMILVMLFIPMAYHLCLPCNAPTSRIQSISLIQSPSLSKNLVDYEEIYF